MTAASRLPVALALLLLSACASVDPGPDFAALRQDLSTRAGVEPVSRRTLQEDEQARGAARERLADGLSAEDAVRVGLLLSPRLQASYERLGLARAGRAQAGLIDNPVFTGSYRRVPGEGHVWELGVAQSLASLVLLPLRLSGADAELAAARAETTGEVLDFIAEVKTAYADHAAAEARHAAAARSADLSDAAWVLARRMRAAGNVTEMELLERRAVREEDRLTLAEAERALHARREALNRLLGLWGELADWQGQDGLPPPPDEEPPLDDLESRAVRDSLDLSAAEARLTALARTRGVADVASFIGETEVGLSLEKDPGEPWGRGPSWAVPIPLFDLGGAARARTRAELRQARAGQEALAVAVRSAAREARFDLEAARQRTAYLSEVALPLRRRLTHEAQLQYNAMALGPFALMTAKREEYQAEARAAQALADYWRARARLDALLAGRLTRGAGESAASPAASPAKETHP